MLLIEYMKLLDVQWLHCWQRDPNLLKNSWNATTRYIVGRQGSNLFTNESKFQVLLGKRNFLVGGWNSWHSCLDHKKTRRTN